MRFEDDRTRHNEKAVAAFLANAWNVTLVSRPAYDVTDFDVIVPDAKTAGNTKWGEIEIKGRDRTWTERPTVEIAMKKVVALQQRAAVGGLRVGLVFLFERDKEIGVISVHKIDTSPERTYFGGRLARVGSANDQEAMVRIPLAELTPVPGHIEGVIASPRSTGGVIWDSVRGFIKVGPSLR